MSQNKITKTHIKDSLEFDEYFQLCSDLAQQQSSTSFKEDEKYVHFTKLNFVRMKRLYKTVVINPVLKEKIKQITEPQVWLVIAESWCGDASQALPLIYAASQLNSKIKMGILLREQNLEVMDAYLTNGSRSIPKWISLNGNNLEEIFVWGPRPEILQKYVDELKEQEYEEKSKNIQLWYNNDDSKSMQAEMEKLF